MITGGAGTGDKTHNTVATTAAACMMLPNLGLIRLPFRTSVIMVTVAMTPCPTLTATRGTTTCMTIGMKAGKGTTLVITPLRSGYKTLVSLSPSTNLRDLPPAT